MSADTSWIVPGAEVIIITDGSTIWRAERSTIATVATKSFTVAGQHGHRFNKLDPHISVGYVTYVVVPFDSEKATQALARQGLNDRKDAVESAYNGWRRDRDNSLKLAALESAVQKLKAVQARARSTS